MSFTAEKFRNAYKEYAIEWAQSFLKEAYEHAKMYPDTSGFSRTIYSSKKIIDKIYEHLDLSVSKDITIEQDWRDTKEGDVCATFRIIW